MQISASLCSIYSNLGGNNLAANTINGSLLRKMILKASESLNDNKDAIDSLNVFPVPDGDTGTNMSLTVLNAAREVARLPEDCSVPEIAQTASFGALKGARGNSGVILSQLFRGFAKELENKTSVCTSDIANAFKRATDTAYKAVMKPKEGTILTVAREIAAKALEICSVTTDFSKFAGIVLEHGYATLEKTKDMLPILKQANVVDAGGLGLLCLLKGAASCLESEVVVDISKFTSAADSKTEVDFSKLAQADENIEFAYCTEFFVNYEKNESFDKKEDDMKAFLDKIGDSIVVVADDTMMKIHVHTNAPGAILEKAIDFGYLSNIKIENMRLQHNEKISFLKEDEDALPKSKQPANYVHTDELKDYAFIAVSSGEGFRTIFESLNIDEIIEGGQTLNPSAEAFVDAIERIAAKHIFIFPNNKNIILAAEQASTLCKRGSVHVVPTKSIPQGINALLNFVYEDDLDSNLHRFEESIAEVKTGQITSAVRDTVLGDKQIKKGDTLCIIDGDIAEVAQSPENGVKALLRTMLDDSGYLNVYFGENVSSGSAEELENYISENYPDIEFEVASGGQPVYDYIISVI